MSNLIRSTTALAHYLISAYSNGPDGRQDAPFVAVDATCGNGHDTLALAQLLWESANTTRERSMPDGDPAADAAEPETATQARLAARHLLAFDVQETALAQTRERLCGAGYADHLQDGRISLIADGHEHMAKYLGGQEAHVIVFNLGYLPGGDKTATTLPETTLAAVETAIRLLAVDGLLCITMYSGHETGAIEKAGLLRFSEALDASRYHVSYVEMLNQHAAPELLLITRKK